MELILRAVLTGILGPSPVRFLSMSSKLLPCVSGTNTMTKTRAKQQHAPYIRNRMPKPSPPPNVLVMMKVANQLKLVAIEAPEPLILAVYRKVLLVERINSRNIMSVNYYVCVTKLFKPVKVHLRCKVQTPIVGVEPATSSP